MTNQITGRVDRIGQTIQIPSKSGGNPFLKREITLDATPFDPYTGERSTFENFPTFEFSGDKCAELDNFSAGQVVTISFAIQGRKWTDADGNLKYITSVRGYKIEARQTSTQQAPTAQPTVQQVPDLQPQQDNSRLPF